MEVSIPAEARTQGLTITVQGIKWDEIEQGAVYAGELQVREVLKAIGQVLTVAVLRSKDVSTPTLLVNGESYYRKEATPGHYQTLYGEVIVPRHRYQRSTGGQTVCPLEERGQLRFGAAPPLLAEVVSFKLASASAREVAQDLAKSHGVALSDTYVHQLAQTVGQVAVEKQAVWELRTPAPAAPVALIATGVEGTTLPIVHEAYKEAMCGTIALYDAAGERLQTQYLGTMPEAGKVTFAQLMRTRVAQVLARYPAAVHVCLGDGAQWNWDFFAVHYPDAVWVLDFYHAATHLQTAAEAIWSPGAAAHAYADHWRTTLRYVAGGVASLLRSLLYYRNRRPLTPAAQQALDTELKYFRTHAHLMQYAELQAAGLPIGSGVTEAGCKELIKARFCRSGMRWKRASGAPILQLRAIKLSHHWDSFWAKVLRYAA
jgi:hypothetical protein